MQYGFQPTGETLNIIGSNFSNNKATNGNGGAIYSVNPLTINNCNFVNNYAKNNGGALYLSAPTKINSSNFKNNVANGNGGGIYSRNGLNISKSSISKNSATYGSGVYSSSTLRVDSSSLSSNTAKFIKIVISAPNSANSGSNVAIKSGLVYGDNVAGAFYTTNGNIFINGKKSTVSNYSPNKKITLNFNGKTIVGNSGSNGIATFKVNIKVSKNKIYKAIVSSKQGSKTFSTSKNIKFTIVKSTSKSVFKSTSSSSSVVKASASGTKKTSSNTFLPSSKTINTPFKGVKEIYNPNKKKGVNANGKNYSSNPDKKFRIKVKHKTKTVKYQFVSKMQGNKKTKSNKSTTITTETYRKDNKIIKSTTTVKVYYKYQYLKNPFLSVTINCEVNNPKIKNKAKEITRNHKTNYAKANAIWNWVRKNVKYDKNAHYSAVETLDKKTGSCQGHSNLIVALCRAVGIPTQYEARVYYEKDYSSKAASISNSKISQKTLSEGHKGHVWALVYINKKWYVADGTMKNFPKSSFDQLVSPITHPNHKFYKGKVNITYLLYGKGGVVLRTFSYDCNYLTGKFHKDKNVKWTS